MNRQISTQEKIEFFEDDWGKTGLLKHGAGLETLWQRQDDLGKGFMRKIEVRPGLKLLIRDFQPCENVALNFEVESLPLVFSFLVSGTIRNYLRLGLWKKEFDFVAGQSSISSFSEMAGTAEHPSGQRMRMINIWISPTLLNSFLEGESGRIPADLRGIMDGSNGNHCLRFGTVTASMQIAIHEILNCPYHGSIKRMYLESKSIELICHQLAQTVFDRNCIKNQFNLRPDDIERIRHAADLLDHNIEKPPTILELSRMVGLNDFKLKKGFREIYETTVYGYLLDRRFEQARRLLAEGQMSVYEVSYAIGYSNVDHFSQSFKKRCGINPGAYRRNSQGSIK
jgi:AraC-like DNA-binding protein